MDLSQLQIFDLVVQQGSFSKAARLLNISQPTASLRIQALEQEVGGSLFLRSSNHISLTDLGKTFLPYARQTIDILTTGVETAQLTNQGKRGRVIIGTLPSFATGFFASTLKHLRGTHPHLDIAVHTGHSQQVIEMLYDGFIHVGFIEWPFFSPDLVTLFHIREQLVVVANASHPLAGIECVDIAELSQLADPFFCIDWSAEIKAWEAQLVESRMSTIEIPPQTAHDLLRQGTGVALLPLSHVLDELQTGLLVEVKVGNLPALYRECVLVRLKRDNPLPTSVHAFIEIFHQEAFKYRVPTID